ncbi:hypothetical protein Tco_1230743, partial [Tanacetum coccineum]
MEVEVVEGGIYIGGNEMGFEDLSDIGSPRADDHEYLKLPYIPEDPYLEAALQDPPSLDYVPGPEEPKQAPLSPDYVPGPKHADDDIDIDADEEDEDDEMGVEVDEEAEEEHPAPAYPVVVALPATAPSAEETEPFETDESVATPPPHLAYCMTARITIPEPEHPEDLVPAKDEAPTPLLPPSFLSPRIRPLSPRALAVKIRDVASSLYHLLHPSGTPPLLPIPLPALSTSRRADIPKADTPPQKRLLLTTPRPKCEVGESSATAAVRQPGPTMAHRVDYSHVDTMETRFRDTERGMMTALEMVNIRVS